MKIWTVPLTLLLAGAATFAILSARAGANDEADEGASSQEDRLATEARVQDLPPDPTSLMLTIGIDADGVEIVQATRKSQLAYRATKAWQEMPFRWILRDAEGRLLDECGFDPGELCLIPEHKGQPPHAPGDHLRPHQTHTNIKIPDYGARTASIEFQVLEGSDFVTVSRAEADALEAR